MDSRDVLRLDVTIFGGGASGLWLLDELVRAGYRALVLEAALLGSGQTVTSQGIIHGGVKYSLGRLLSPSTRAIRDMPVLWRRCLAGERAPKLTGTARRAEFCHLWQTGSIASRLGMLGARAGLEVAPVPLPREAWPEPLRDCSGSVARLDEQVIDPESFLTELGNRHFARILRIDVDHGLEFDGDASGQVDLIRCLNPDTGEPLDLRSNAVVLTAGAGNAELRRQVGLTAEVMQRRPLQMVVARGPLPTLNGHCVDGLRTRATITTARDYANRAIWQIGGQIAEDGASMTRAGLMRHAREELEAILPGVDLDGVDWATYRVDRAEHATARRGRPAEAAAVRNGRVIAGWPTKLALVPRLVEKIRHLLPPPQNLPPIEPDMLGGWPRPAVAVPPWEEEQWWSTGA